MPDGKVNPARGLSQQESSPLAPSSGVLDRLSLWLSTHGGCYRNAFTVIPRRIQYMSWVLQITWSISCRKLVPGFSILDICLQSTHHKYVPPHYLRVSPFEGFLAKPPRFSLAHALHWSCIETLGELYCPLYYFTGWPCTFIVRLKETVRVALLGTAWTKIIKIRGCCKLRGGS